MLPVNVLNALKDYTLAQTLAQKTQPIAVADAVSKIGQQFELGQKLQGTVQAQVAPNVFKVNVSGQLVQMELPASVRSGDKVALQVVSLLPRLTFSMVNSATPLSTPEQLGATSRMLSSMSQQIPEKAYVRAAQSAPLWGTSNPPESKQLAGMLQEALSNSGLFYESHQAQWLGGERSTAQLMHEPQNLTPEQARVVAAPNTANKTLMTNDTVVKPEGAGNTLPNKLVLAGEAASKAMPTAEPASKNMPTAEPASKTMVKGEPASKTLLANDTLSQPAGTGDTASKQVVVSDNTNKAAMTWDAASKTGMTNDNTGMVNDNTSPAVISNNTADTNAPKQPNAPSIQDGKAAGIPDHLQPLVQQQLNALETRQMMWQGNVWPGQDMQWEVHEQVPQNPSMEAQRQWFTQIQMDLPNLGTVAATLRLNSAGLSLTLNAGSPQTRTALGNASTRLVSALSDAGIPVLSAKVSNEQP